MEYQKIINSLDNINNQPSKFRTKTWFEVNNNARETYNSGNKLKLKTTMLRSSLCGYSDATC